MNIILVSNHMAKPRTFSGLHIVIAMFSFFMFSCLISAVFIYEKNNMKHQVVKVMSPAQLEKSITVSQMHLDTYAKQIGELQARIMRLDAQNKRLVKLASITKDKNTTEKAKDIHVKPMDTITSPGIGGPLVNARPMTEIDLQAAIAALSATISNRDDYMNDIEADVLQHSVLKDMLPNANPVSVAYRSSSYGWRIDPFTGYTAFHEGLDFPAMIGDKIRAAADGIVTGAMHTPAYGNLIKLSHGAGLETRYAHASKVLVQTGDRVVKGQVIGLVGNTGRSTGPHLHYEIRLNGSPLDPRKYLSSH
jgi:murein DD-endopeptidase MepM/ murein hydrolase activator NlpD